MRSLQRRSLSHIHAIGALLAMFAVSVLIAEPQNGQQTQGPTNDRSRTRPPSSAQPQRAVEGEISTIAWGQSFLRNNVSQATDVPRAWEVGKLDRQTGIWTAAGAQNMQWVTPIGSQTYSSPIVYGDRVFIGGNNARGYLKRFPSDVDLGCMFALDRASGQFVWQYSAQKMRTGRVNDWPLQGIPSSPTVSGERMWFVDNRGQVVCLDTRGFQDEQDDGPHQGVWHRLFDTTVDLAVDMNRWNIPFPLYAAMQQEGLPIEKSWMQREGDHYLISYRKQGVTFAAYRLEVEERSIRVMSTDPAETRPLCQVDRFPFRDLAEGKFTPGLARMLVQAGCGLESRTVKKLSSGAWGIDVRYDGRPSLCRVQISAGKVSAQVQVQDLQHEADVVWLFDMPQELGTFQHNMATCSPAIWGDLLFVTTGNGVDESHLNLPNPDAPSFIALDKTTGEVVWTDDSPGNRVFHGQWCSPAVGVFDGVPQVIVAGGDGWVYSFHAEEWDAANQRPNLLWKFDGNPKSAKWQLGGRGTRNNIVAFPVIYNRHVYITMGQDPEHGEGTGCLWCIDPTRRGDVSPEVLIGKSVNDVSREESMQGFRIDQFEPNPNSALIWKYDRSGPEFHQTMHRAISSPVIHDDLLIVPDLGGIIHCLDAKTGEVHWTCDSLANCWCSPLVADGHAYIGTEDGEVLIFPMTSDPAKVISPERKFPNHGEALHRAELPSSVYSTPTAVGNHLIIATRSHLHCIGK